MLQEILLSLSGAPSPIWEELKNKNNENGLQNHVSQPEQSMLATLSHLSQLHIDVKEHATAISSKHASLVCRAVSSSINNQQLSSFREKVIEVESSILSNNASHVGAYKIVPLSTLVADFAPWIRRLEWLQKVTGFMRASRSKGSSTFRCTSADIMRFLENERHTGFTDVEEIATHLFVVAQATWMRFIVSWVLYAQLPSPGREDFMIRQIGETQENRHVIEKGLTPGFVSTRAADYILAIGGALARIRSPSSTAQAEALQDMQSDLLTKHLPKIKLLTYPLNPFLLESTMAEINVSVSQNALSHLLPRSKLVNLCAMLRDYMLLAKGEFAIALIENADARITSRQKSQQSIQPTRKLGRFSDMLIKDAELKAILSKTWSDLAVLQSQHEIEDEIYEMAKQYMRLKVIENTEQDSQSMPLATLLPTPTMLQIEFSQDSPIQLFLTASERQQYSDICAYLLSIRRSQLRCSNLWKLTSHRRCHPTPLGPPLSTTDFGQRACKLRRHRENLRAVKMRCYWSSMNKALFLLNEFNAYLHGEVTGNSWKQFEAWLEVASEKPKQATHLNTSDCKDDPRALALAHSRYLTALHSGLLLEHSSFVQTVRELLLQLDHFIALFHRIAAVWQGLDLQEDDGVMDAFTNYIQEEIDTISEMTRARIGLEDMLEQFMKNLKNIEKVQDTSSLSGIIAGVSIAGDSTDDFVPWKARTLDRLIMKLDFLYPREERAEAIVDDYEYD